MRFAIFIPIVVILLTACSSDRRSPDAIREETAKATSTAARDAKAVAKGVVDGIKESGPININKASEKELESLPGIDAATAQKIIADRPYSNSADLVRRQLITKTEYDHIAGRIETR